MDNNNYLCTTKNLKIMRKILTFVLMICLSVCVYAQDEYNVYICIHKYGKNVEVKTPSTKGASTLIDENGKPLNFGNESEVLSFFGSMGWEYKGSYEEQILKTPDLWFVMEKRVRGEEDAFKGIPINPKDVKKND